MLRIKKRFEVTKPMTAGAIAFAVGLMGTVSYLEALNNHENLVFTKQQKEPTSSPSSPAEASVPIEAVPNSSDASSATSEVQPAQTTLIAPTNTAAASQAPASAAATISGAAQVDTSSPVNPTGATSTGTSTPDPTQTNPTPDTGSTTVPIIPGVNLPTVPLLGN